MKQRTTKGNEIIRNGELAIACDRSSNLDGPYDPYEEIIGGFGLVVPYKSARDCLLLAKLITAPLAASVYGSREIARQLKVGTVWVDCVGMYNPAITRSRFGRVGNGVVGGRAGLVEFLVPAGEEPARLFWKRMDKIEERIKGYDKMKQADVGAAIEKAKKAVAKWALGTSDMGRSGGVGNIAMGLLAKKPDLNPFFPETVDDSLEAAFVNVEATCVPENTSENVSDPNFSVF